MHRFSQALPGKFNALARICPSDLDVAFVEKPANVCESDSEKFEFFLGINPNIRQERRHRVIYSKNVVVGLMLLRMSSLISGL